MALGGIFGSLLGGYTLSQLSIDTIFLLFSILPAIQLLSCSLIKESPLESNGAQNHDSITMKFKDDVGYSNRKNSFTKASKTSRRKSKHNNDNKRMNLKYESPIRQPCSRLERYYISLKSNICNLVGTFKQPIILR